jgi:hypothetical protein
MKDSDIRPVLKNRLALDHQADPSTFVTEELGLLHGMVRIDVAVINTIFHGYEIKSDHDTLKRLPVQISVYSSVLDRVTLLVGYRHAYEALMMVPEWWGVELVNKRKDGSVHFEEARESQLNPTPDFNAIAALLWRKEALEVLEQKRAATGIRSKQRTIIYRRLVDVCDEDELRFIVRTHLKNRLAGKSVQLLTSNDD